MINALIQKGDQTAVKSKPMTGISMYLSGTAARITLWKTKRISDSEMEQVFICSCRLWNCLFYSLL